MTQFWWKHLRRYCIHPVFRAITCSDLDLWPLIPKANQHIDEPKYICGQNWVKFPSLGCEIWYSQSFRVIASCDLDVWSFDLVSMSQALIHTSPNFGEISWNIYENIVFTWFSGHCVLWPWPVAARGCLPSGANVCVAALANQITSAVSSQGIYQDFGHGGVNQPFGVPSSSVPSYSLSSTVPSTFPYPTPSLPLEVAPLNPARRPERAL